MIKLYAVFLSLGLSLAVPGSTLAANNTDARLKAVETLIEKSSGAKQIEISGNPQANAKRDEARALLRQAEAALNAGDRKAADGALARATKTMVEAVRLANPQAVVEDKKEADFRNRLESVNALLKAHERISREKGKNAEIGALRGIVDGKLAKAQSLYDSGQLDEARKVLDETYVATKTAIEHLRGGDTLVRSLKFASKEEEYRYELDRNDTHRMLVKVLLEEKMKDANVGKAVKQYMDKAADLRAQAEQQAARGDYAGAVGTLETSTKEIARAIRSAGIYIPG
ncbi:MAG: hypothetical protein U1F68_16005 [Gammaproteobacteria bacterium]